MGAHGWMAMDLWTSFQIITDQNQELNQDQNQGCYSGTLSKNRELCRQRILHEIEGQECSWVCQAPRNPIGQLPLNLSESYLGFSHLLHSFLWLETGFLYFSAPMAQHNSPTAPRFTYDSTRHMQQLEVSVPRPNYWEKECDWFISGQVSWQSWLKRQVTAYKYGTAKHPPCGTERQFPGSHR